ncbi:hypothetical protein LTR36_005676 [Oleoguttula mirabilis]|uniref:Uncharacterized protein n=1 Tax=Oleoguttula mirabilis TaxID=1507867 RepID=A0AAV9JEW4_9PEZI|nr:hypothetical protein LTR36_005676 [Oleoguttula mirabilis]
MGITTLALYAAMAVLMVDAALEMATISSMVYWLHYRAGKAFEIDYNLGSFSLHGKPVGLLTNQGHTSNGAAGTAFVAVGLGGILALWSRSRGKHGKRFYHFWLVMTVLSMLLSLAALIYTFLLTNNHAGQTINIALASGLHNEPYPNYVSYPLDLWTPENWLDAVSQLDIARSSDRNDIKSHLDVMKLWRWNLIPLFILGMIVCGLAVMDAFGRRKEMQDKRAMNGYGAEAKRMST